MKLAFLTRKGYKEKDVDIVLNFGTLESLCRDLNIDFFQIDIIAKKDRVLFMTNLLYHGYLTNYQECFTEVRKKGKLFAWLFLFRNPLYDKVNALIWYEKMSQEAQKELTQKMIALSGEIKKLSGSKKKVS
jgi:hypothetical protein